MLRIRVMAGGPRSWRPLLMLYYTLSPKPFYTPDLTTLKPLSPKPETLTTPKPLNPKPQTLLHPKPYNPKTLKA